MCYCVIVGIIGFGKFIIVVSLMNVFFDEVKYFFVWIIMFDFYGEYGSVLWERVFVFWINFDLIFFDEKLFNIFFWVFNFDEFCEVCFGEFNNEKDRNIVLERV